MFKFEVVPYSKYKIGVPVPINNIDLFGLIIIF